MTSETKTPDSESIDEIVEDTTGDGGANGAGGKRDAATGLRPLIIASGLVALALVIGQVAVLAAVWNTNSKISELDDDVRALTETAAVDPDDLADLGTGRSSSAPDASSPSNETADGPGSLPRFLGAGADPALGLGLSSLTAPDYYGGVTTTVDPSDGKARAYMVWAHWCPFCQEELPLMAEWHAENAESFEDFELVSVTTAIDETATNPLVPYLDENQFPFPVLVDEDGSLSRQLGVNAFPFWVFTAPDGTVVGRAAGLIELDELTQVFEELENL